MPRHQSQPTHLSLFFFFNDTATTEIYTLSLHDALPILRSPGRRIKNVRHLDSQMTRFRVQHLDWDPAGHLFTETVLSLDHSAISTDSQLERRSEEHTSELQSRQYLVCRLLLEKKKNTP